MACILETRNPSSQGILRLTPLALSTTVTAPFLKAAPAISIVETTAALVTLPPTLRVVSATTPVACMVFLAAAVQPQSATISIVQRCFISAETAARLPSQGRF